MEKLRNSFGRSRLNLEWHAESTPAPVIRGRVSSVVAPDTQPDYRLTREDTTPLIDTAASISRIAVLARLPSC